MDINPTDVQEMLSQTTPASPDASEIESNRAAAQSEVANTVANTLAGKTGTPTNPNFPTPTRQTTGQNQDMMSVLAKGAPGSFSQKFRDALMTPSNGKPMSVMAEFAKAGVKAMSGGQPSTLEAALAGNDTTRPTSAPIAPRQLNRGEAAVQNITDTIGDVAAAPGPGGFLGGFARTAAAGTQRRTEELKNKQALATANAQMLHEQALTHQLGEEQINKAVDTGRQGLEAMMSAPVAASVIAKDKTADDLRQMIQKGELKPTEETVFLTGRTPAGTDTNGQPLFRSTYTVVKPGGPVTVNDKQAAYLNEQLLRDDIQPGQVLPSVQFNSLWQQAQNHESAAGARNLALAKIGEEVNKANLDRETQMLGTDKSVLNAVAAAQSGPNDPHALVKAYNALIANPEFMKTHPDFTETYPKWAGGGNVSKFETMQQKFAEAQDKAQKSVTETLHDVYANPEKMEGKTPSVIAMANSVINDPNAAMTDKAFAAKVKAEALDAQNIESQLQNAKELSAAEAKKKAAEGPTSDLIGEQFLATLPVGRRTAVQAIGEGRVPSSPSAMQRTDKGMSLMSDVTQAYPDYDWSKAESYGKLRSDFTSGKEATGINQSNTALHHINLMQRALDRGATLGYTGGLEQFLGANDAGRSLANEAKALSEELSKFYTGGVAAQGDTKDWQDRLNPNTLGMTNSKLRKNIKDFTQLLGGKLEAFQDQWDDGVPSARIQAPKAIAAPDTIETYKRITGEDLKVHSTQQNKPQPQTPPPGATMKVPGSDGKMHWSNGSADLGIVE